jgi:TonB dependent receptor
MHMGFQGWRQRIDTFYSGNNGRAGTFNFNGRYTAGPSSLATAGPGSGIAEADFMLGLPSDIGGGVNGGTWGQRANVFGAFFQDDWHVTPNLTLNLGLRWELHTPWVEVKNRQANFDLVTGAESIAGQNGASRALYNQYNGITNFQPRIGFAWTPGGRSLVLRGAYTMSSYLEGTGTNLRLPINPPFAGEHELDYTKLTTGLPGSTLDQGFTPFATADVNPFAGATLRVWDPNVRPAVSNQWNFTVQQQLGSSTTVQVGYVGQRTNHLMVPMPYFQKRLLADGTVAPSPFLAGNQTLVNEIGQISGTASNGNQSYHALQAVIQKRLSGGLQYSVAYTYSKCMADAIGYYGAGGQSGSQSAYWQNVYNSAAEWGPCFYDVTHVLTANAVYDLPFGRNRQFGKNLNNLVNGVLGDWQISGIASFHTGFPLTISAGDNSGTGSRGARANCDAPSTVFGARNSPLGGYQWFDPSVYSAPARGTFGNCGVGTVRGPGLHTVDMSLVKIFPITERQALEFRGEFINLTNTPILNAPNHSLGSQLGLIQSSQGARNIQFGLKYSF